MKYRYLIIFAVVALMFPLLAACADDDEETGDVDVVETTTGVGADATETGANDTPEVSTEPPTVAESPASDASPEAAAGGDSGPIAIGSKDFPEQLILGEMYVQLLEANGFEVDPKLNLGGTFVAHEAIQAGEIDLYPEYTGTGLLAILEMGTMSDPDEVYQVVNDEYQQRFNLTWLEPAPMNNSQALAVTREFAEENNVTTISDMAAIADQLVLAAPPDFPEREDGLLGLKRVYGDFDFQEIKVIDPGLKYQALLNGEADVVLAFGTDGEIEGNDLVVLEDDQGLWPPYHVAPVVRQDTLDANPEIADILNELAPLLTDEVMRDLNWRVAGPDAEEPADVAHDFLVENGLIEE